MANQSPEIAKSKEFEGSNMDVEVEECLQKVEEMKKKNEDSEVILSVISNTLEEMYFLKPECKCSSPEDAPILEGAKLNYMLARILIDVIHVRS